MSEAESKDHPTFQRLAGEIYGSSLSEIRDISLRMRCRMQRKRIYGDEPDGTQYPVLNRKRHFKDGDLKKESQISGNAGEGV